MGGMGGSWLDRATLLTIPYERLWLRTTLLTTPYGRFWHRGTLLTIPYERLADLGSKVTTFSISPGAPGTPPEGSIRRRLSQENQF